MLIQLNLQLMRVLVAVRSVQIVMLELQIMLETKVLMMLIIK